MSICNAILFAVSEEVISDTAVWLRVANCLSTPSQVAILATLCRASREVADGAAVWGKLLTRWYPKATLLNPDWMAQAELEKRLEAALDNDYTLAALCRRLENDTALDIGDLLRALPQQTTPKVLVKFMSSHPENFRQSPDGKKFAALLGNPGIDQSRRLASPRSSLLLWGLPPPLLLLLLLSFLLVMRVPWSPIPRKHVEVGMGIRPRWGAVPSGCPLALPPRRVPWSPLAFVARRRAGRSSRSVAVVPSAPHAACHGVLAKRRCGLCSGEAPAAMAALHPHAHGKAEHALAAGGDYRSTSMHTQTH